MSIDFYLGTHWDLDLLPFELVNQYIIYLSSNQMFYLPIDLSIKFK